MKVKKLDPHLVNKIAAGEVIERPASVVKELMENSIDAQASRIEIKVKKAGIKEIMVSDDGEGLSEEDLKLAVKRHTTSKISREEDLENIHTLGFRGEALASIMEISRLSITAKRESDPAGVKLSGQGGRIEEVRSASRGQGTTVQVEDLFYNTPARKKYLRTERTEFYHIKKMVKRFILSYPGIHFQLAKGDKKIIDSPQTGNLKEVIADLYDTKLAKSMIEIKSSGNQLRVTGLVSNPQYTRSNRREQFTFVNGRYVRNRTLSYIIGKSYEGAVEKNRHPFIFLYIDIAPQMVDVNVHPKKEEVRFTNVGLVKDQVKQAITDGLRSEGMSFRSINGPSSKVTSSQTPTSWQKKTFTSPDGDELDLRSELAEEKELKKQVEGLDQEGEYKIMGQIFDTYILVETGRGLRIIDQHIAHERFLFEKLMDQISAGTIEKQRLLIPITVDLPFEEADLLKDNLKLLEEKLGVGIEDFGHGSFILRDWPEILAERLSKDDFKKTLESIVEALKNEDPDEIKIDELIHKLAAQMACHGAIKAGASLDYEEMIDLLTKLETLDNPRICPHGRPIIIEYSQHELNQMFKRD